MIFAILLGCCVFFAVTFSIVLIDTGTPYFTAIFYASSFSFFISFTPFWIFWGIRKKIWEHTRGYPFSICDRVQITSGRYQGCEATIIHYSQDQISYGIFIEEFKHQEDEFFAGYLKRKPKLDSSDG